MDSEKRNSFLDDDFPSLRSKYEQVKCLSDQCRESVKNWNRFLKRKMEDVDGIVPFLRECASRLTRSKSPRFLQLMEEEFLPAQEQYGKDLADFESECFMMAKSRATLLGKWEQMQGGFVLFKTERQLRRHQNRLMEWKMQRWNLEKTRKNLLSARHHLIKKWSEMEQELRKAIDDELNLLLVRQNLAAEDWNDRLRKAKERYSAFSIDEVERLTMFEREDGSVEKFVAAFSIFQKWGFEGPIMNATKAKLTLPSDLEERSIPTIPKDLSFHFERAKLELENKWIYYVFWSLAAAGIVILTTAIFVSRGDGSIEFF